MKPNFRKFIATPAFIDFLYRFIRLYSHTFRLTVENEAPWLAHLDTGGKVLLCTWHQQFFSAIRHFKIYQRYQPSLMISQSNDGHIIAGVANRSGWQTPRGSSSSNGRVALLEMVDLLNRTRLGGHILDGPRGPIGCVKPGVIRLAQATGAAIVPFHTQSEHAWLFNSWDRFMLPRPFSRVYLRFDRMITVNDIVNKQTFENKRLQLEQIMRKHLIT